MITNKDIRVENGNLVLNGDKYPLDGQSPEAIMAIVKDNSDTTPTENSTAPITSGGVYPLTNSSTVSGTNVLFSRFGKLRILNSNRCTFEDLKTFYNNLPLADKPKSLRFTVMLRTSNDNKYMTTSFVYVGTSGLNAVHFAAYNANEGERQVENTDRLIGELVYTVD